MFTSRTQESRSESVLLCGLEAIFAFPVCFARWTVRASSFHNVYMYVSRFPRANTRITQFMYRPRRPILRDDFPVFVYVCSWYDDNVESENSLSLCLSSQWAMFVANCTLRGSGVWYRLSTPLLFIGSSPGAVLLGHVRSRLKIAQ